DSALVVLDLFELLLQKRLRASAVAGKFARKVLALFFELGQRRFDLVIALGLLLKVKCKLVALELQSLNRLVGNVGRVLPPNLRIAAQVSSKRLEYRDSEQSLDPCAHLR